jgi:hypothetical protein
MDKDAGTLCTRIHTPPIYSIHHILFNLPMYTLLPVLAIYLRLYLKYTISYPIYHCGLTREYLKCSCHSLTYIR